MYGESNIAPAVAAPVAVLGTTAVLPSTGADFITTAATAVAAGLVTWGALYFLKVVRG